MMKFTLLVALVCISAGSTTRFVDIEASSTDGIRISKFVVEIEKVERDWLFGWSDKSRSAIMSSSYAGLVAGVPLDSGKTITVEAPDFEPVQLEVTAFGLRCHSVSDEDGRRKSTAGSMLKIGDDNRVRVTLGRSRMQLP